MEGHKAYGAGVREYRDSLALVIAKYLPKFPCRAAEQVAVALAIGYHVVNAAVHEGVVILGVIDLGFVECKSFKYPDVAFTEGLCSEDGDTDQPGKRLGRLHGPVQIA